MKRIVNATRLHFVNPSALITLPWAIMAAIVLFAVGVWLILSATGAEATVVVSGAWMVVYMLVAAIQAVTRTLPYGLSMSLARYEYAAGTALAFVAVSLFNSVIFTVLTEIETWTDGWGLGGYVFTVPAVTDGPVLERWLVFFVAFLLFFFIGWVFAAMFARWRAWGLFGLGVGLLFALVGAGLIIARLGAWAEIGRWVIASGPAGFAAWMLVPTAVAAVCGYLLLLRVTPRG